MTKAEAILVISRHLGRDYVGTDDTNTWHRFEGSQIVLDEMLTDFARDILDPNITTY